MMEHLLDRLMFDPRASWSCQDRYSKDSSGDECEAQHDD